MKSEIDVVKRELDLSDNRPAKRSRTKGKDADEGSAAAAAHARLLHALRLQRQQMQQAAQQQRQLQLQQIQQQHSQAVSQDRAPQKPNPHDQIDFFNGTSVVQGKRQGDGTAICKRGGATGTFI